MKKTGLKRYAVALMAAIGLTVALAGVAGAETTGEATAASNLSF